MARLERRAGATLCCTWASVLLAVACLHINHVHLVGAIEAPCTACKAVATELQRRMDNEGVRNHLDLRHRLDKHGKRYGKVIPYKHSEQRAVELLDGLCGAMHDYTLVTVTHNETGKKTIHWAKYQGEGAHQVPKEQRPPSMEEEAHKKRLEVYCGNMMEEYEEQLYEGITKDVFDEKGVESPLCYKMTNACPKHDVSDKRKPQAAGEAPPASEASGGAGEL